MKALLHEKKPTNFNQTKCKAVKSPPIGASSLNRGVRQLSRILDPRDLPLYRMRLGKAVQFSPFVARSKGPFLWPPLESDEALATDLVEGQEGPKGG